MTLGPRDPLGQPDTPGPPAQTPDPTWPTATGRDAVLGAGPARPNEEAAFARAMEEAPAAVAVVMGEAHTLLYANAAFHALAHLHDDAVPGVVLGAPIAASFSTTAGHALLAVLDGVRATGLPGGGTLSTASDTDVSTERGTEPGTGPGTVSRGPTGDAWPCTAWPVVDAEGAAPGARIVVAVDASRAAALTRVQHRDVTERVLLSAFREEARADVADAARSVAEAANTARAQLLAATSHELRTPLQAIGGYAELLEMGVHGPVTDGQRDALGRIQLAMRHLVGITTMLLDHAKLEAGRVQYALAAVPVAAALDEATSLVAPQAAAKQLTLTVAPVAPGLTACADPGKLRQIVVNLLANAVKFTAAGGAITVSGGAERATRAAAVGDSAPPDARTGGGRRATDVHATTTATAPAGHVVTIHVTDTGCGIAADQLALVFDPFVQVGRRVTAREGGVGLGLAISRDLARGMGGDLMATSIPGVGSTFTLTLPAANAHSQDGAAGASAA